MVRNYFPILSLLWVIFTHQEESFRLSGKIHPDGSVRVNMDNSRWLNSSPTFTSSSSRGSFRPLVRQSPSAPGPLGHALRFSQRGEAGGSASSLTLLPGVLSTPRPPNARASSAPSSPGSAPSGSLTSSASGPSLRLRVRPGAEVGARGDWNAESGGRCSQWEASLARGWEAGPARVLG